MPILTISAFVEPMTGVMMWISVVGLVPSRTAASNAWKNDFRQSGYPDESSSTAPKNTAFARAPRPS